MNFFRNRPPLRRPPSSNSLIDPARGGGLPVWASSADFRDFENGADRRAGVTLLESPAPNSVDEALRAQTADGMRSARTAGVEDAGVIVKAAKPYIMRELEAGGFNDEDARALFEAADSIPNSFWVWPPPGKLDTKVTPDEDRAFRREAERANIDAALRKKALEFYESQFAKGRLRRVDR